MSDAKKYKVFKIVNINKKSPAYRKTAVLISSTYTKNSILSHARTYANSDTAGGGMKDLGKDISKAGKGYDDKFKVVMIGKGLTKDEANELRAKHLLKAKTTYNRELDL